MGSMVAADFPGCTPLRRTGVEPSQSRVAEAHAVVDPERVGVDRRSGHPRFVRVEYDDLETGSGIRGEGRTKPRGVAASKPRPE